MPVTAALDRRLDAPRTWTAAQRAPALRLERIRLSTGQRRQYLQGMGANSPELNEIEPVFRAIKHCDLPERVYTPQPALEAAVDAAYTRYAEKLLAKHAYQPRLAA